MTTRIKRVGYGSAIAWRGAPGWAVCLLVICFGAASGADVEERDTPANSQSLSVGHPVAIAQGVETPATPDVVGCPITVLPNDGGTSGFERAPNLRNRFGRTVYLIKATEMTAAGVGSGTTFSKIGWNFQVAPGLSGSGPLIVYLQNTADTTNTKSTTWATAITGMTVVHNATTTIPNVTGTWDIALSAGGAFTYSGGGLYVAFDAQYPVGTLSASTVVWCNSTGLVGGLKGAEGSTAPTTIATSSFRPETRLAPAVATILNDASVDYVVSYGSLAQPLVGPQAVQAVITNKGANALTNVPVTLNVTGAESFSNNQVVPSLAACGGQAVVTFAPFTPAAIGSDSITVLIPPDDVASNNSKSRPLDETYNLYSYKHPGTTASGGVGLTGATGAFVSKFKTTGPSKITAVNLEFALASTTTYRTVIYGDSGSGTPSSGAPLYEDVVDQTVGAAGPVTITLPTPLSVGAGTFYAGIEQTNATNASLSFDNEVPIRSGAFYIASPYPATAWFDFAPGNNFKLNIGVTLVQCTTTADCNDANACTVDACLPATGTCTHTPINCDDGQICTQDSCSPATGACVHTPINCDDGNVCTVDSCIQALVAPACIVPDNGGGTVSLPPVGCDYLSPQDVHDIINGLPAGTTIEFAAIHKDFICHSQPGTPSNCSFTPPPGLCEQPGGTLGGNEECSDSTLALTLNGTGTLAGWNRTLQIPVGFETHVGPRTPGAPFQSFPTDMYRLQGQLPAGDPDFDLLRITAGDAFGLPSPGHTTLSQQPGGNWAVDSFFDITYRIDFIGHPGGHVGGMSGSTTATIRMQTGAGVGCVHTLVNCDDGNPCTVDTCDPVGGCVHTPVNCDDANLCTADSCDPATGSCVHAPINCDGHINREKVLIVFAPPRTLDGLTAVRKKIEASGGRVRAVLGHAGIFAEIEPPTAPEIAAMPGVQGVYTAAIATPPYNDAETVAATTAWNRLLGPPPPPDTEHPNPPPTDAYPTPDLPLTGSPPPASEPASKIQKQPTSTGCPVNGAGPLDTSLYLAGDIAVGVFYTTTGWTPALTASEFANVVYAMNDLLNDESYANIVFTYVSEVDNFGNPNVNPSGFSAERSYDDTLRSTWCTDWAYLIEIRNDSTWPNAYIHGPSLRLDRSWSPYFQVVRHETGHVFGAYDEYGGASGPNNRFGYVNATHGDACTNDGTGYFSGAGECQPDLMNGWFPCYGYWHRVSSFAAGQFGWYDHNGDGIIDVMETQPVIDSASVNHTASNPPTYGGVAYDSPLLDEMPWAGSVSINRIAGVQYRIDNLAWQDATAADLIFDSASEGFLFTTPGLTNGTHQVQIRATNTIGRSTLLVYSQPLVITGSTYTNIRPFGVLSVTPTRAKSGTTVTLNGSASRDAETAPGLLQYSWRWGDGPGFTPFTTTATASHTYAAGTYLVELRVRDTGGLIHLLSRTVVAESYDTAPVVKLRVTPENRHLTSGPSYVVSLNAYGSSDGETPSSALMARWDADDDGNWDGPWSTTKSATVSIPALKWLDFGTCTTPSFVYPKSDRRHVRVQVSDGTNITEAERAIWVIPYNHRPTAPWFNGVTFVPSGSQFIATAHVNDLDLSSTWDGLLEYRWDLDGDGIWDTTFGPSSSMTVPSKTTLRVEAQDRFEARVGLSPWWWVLPGPGSTAVAHMFNATATATGKGTGPGADLPTSFAVGTPIPITFDVDNVGDESGQLTYVVSVLGPDMMPDTAHVSLNGLPPGTPVGGNLSAPIGESTTASVEVKFLDHVPGASFYLMVKADSDHDGNPSELMISVEMHSDPLSTNNCVGASNGTACDDGNLCNSVDTCQAGTCTPGPATVCSASDSCHVAGTCDPGTGVCSNPSAANGTACSDGDACTQTDACLAGACVGSNPVVCTASDQCHVAGACNPGVGTCSNPAAADGTACNDANACTTGDVCTGGACAGTTIPAPAETQNLRVAADHASFSWSAVASATQYDVVRGSLGALPVGPGGGDETCFDNLAGPAVTDPTVPSPGTGRWYLSRGENACGNGTFGTRSNGSPRTTTTCP